MEFVVLINRIRSVAKAAYHMQPFKFAIASDLIRSFDKWIRRKYAGKQVVVRRMGSRFRLDLSQLIDSSICFNEAFEPLTTQRISELVQPGFTAIDIGANIGCHTMLMANRVGKTGRVFAFEPTNYGMNRLIENLSLNDYRNVVLEKMALSDQCVDTAIYSFRSQWSVQGSITDKEAGTVGYTTLDRYIESNKISSLDFIKLDVDGYECKIIKGGLASIKQYLPVIIIELGDTWLRSAGDTIEQLVSLLSDDYLFSGRRLVINSGRG